MKPDVILCVGQAGGRSAVTPERIAVNIRDAKIPDNAGNRPEGEPVDAQGPAAYFSPLPVKAMADAIALLNEKAPNDAVLKLKSIEAMQKIADGQATKIIIPSEMQGLVGMANGIVEGVKE